MYMNARSLHIEGVASTMSVADARKHLAEAIERSGEGLVFIERRGQRAGALISPDEYEQMLDALKEQEDVEAFDVAIAEEGRNLSWAQAEATSAGRDLPHRVTAGRRSGAAEGRPPTAGTHPGGDRAFRPRPLPPAPEPSQVDQDCESGSANTESSTLSRTTCCWSSS